MFSKIPALLVTAFLVAGLTAIVAPTPAAAHDIKIVSTDQDRSVSQAVSSKIRKSGCFVHYSSKRSSETFMLYTEDGSPLSGGSQWKVVTYSGTKVHYQNYSMVFLSLTRIKVFPRWTSIEIKARTGNGRLCEGIFIYA